MENKVKGTKYDDKKSEGKPLFATGSSKKAL